jgi:ATP-binding cassette subfamily B protein
MNSIPARKRTLLRRAVSIVWKSSPALASSNLVILLVQGLLPVASLYLLKLTVDSLEGTITGTNYASFGYIALLIGLMGASALLTTLARSLSGLVGKAQARIVTDRMQDILHEKSVTVDFAYYEDSRYFDTLHRAQSEAPFRPTSIVNGLIQSLQNLITLVAMAALLLTFHWAVALVLVAAAAPGVLVRLKYARELWTWQRDRTETERRAWYKHWLLTSAQHAKELRLLGLGKFFRQRYRNLRGMLRNEMLHMTRRRAAAEFAAQGSATILVYGSFAFIAWRAYQGEITIGDLVMYFQAFQRGLSSLRGLLGSLADLYEDCLFLTNLYEFLDIQPGIASPESPVAFPSVVSSGIRFDHVTFGYPGSSGPVLDDLCLEIRPGETIALVGENGSGKTTLAKLLCRLYDPAGGAVTIDGTSLREFDLNDLRSHISIVFQDFARYHLSARENISLGDTDHADDLPRIIRAAGVTGIDGVLTDLPDGYDTLLGRWFRGGVELSDGEWQKIALARAFFREADIVVLDEPTASLDARSEKEVFTRFRELAGSRTAVLISHRFSSVRIADRIAVLNRGRIVELGTHRELIERNGLYRDMYTIQAEAYD